MHVGVCLHGARRRMRARCTCAYLCTVHVGVVTSLNKYESGLQYSIKGSRGWAQKCKDKLDSFNQQNSRIFTITVKLCQFLVAYHPNNMPPKTSGKPVKKSVEAQKAIAKGDKKKGKKRRKESYAISIY